MKLAFVHFFTFRMLRGVETLVLSLANELARREVDVSILTARQTATPLVVPLPQVKVKAFPTLYYYEFVTIAPFYIADLVRQHYDVVVVFFADFGEGRALQLARPFIKSRLFLYLTFPLETAPHRYRSYQHWGWDKHADCILADAAYTAQRGQEFFKRPVILLPSGTDPERFKPDAERRAAARQRLGLGERDVVLLNVAALEERKGVQRVIEILPQVQAQCPNIRYLVLGEGPLRAGLERRVRELGLGGRVVFVGNQTDLPSYYNAADIFVMLSQGEAGSLACLEAMASGLPVVASDEGGFRQVVSDRVGRMVKLAEPNGCVEAIVELARGPELRADLGRMARQLVIEKFSWDRIAEQFQRLCQQQLRTRRARGQRGAGDA